MDTQIKELVGKGLSINKISKALKITYSQARYLIKKYGLKTNPYNGIYSWDKKTILESIEKSECKSDILRNMNIRLRSGNFQTLDKYCKLYFIDISKLKYKGNRGNTFRNKRDDKDIFIENSTYLSTHNLKRRAISGGFLKNECYKCGNNGIWCGEPLSLQIDHIDGIRTNNKIENLRIACPNCHTQTPTYGGKSRKGTGNQIKKIKKERIQRINVTKEKLEELVWKMPTTKIAEKFNVSGTAVAKKCKKFGIKKPSRGYWAKILSRGGIGNTSDFDSED